MAITAQIEYTSVLIEMIQRLIQNPRLETNLEVYDFEEVKSMKYLDIPRNRKAIKPYLDSLRQHCNRLTS